VKHFQAKKLETSLTIHKTLVGFDLVHRPFSWPLAIGTDWLDKDLVFTNATGDFYSPSTMLKVFKRFLVRIGLPQMRFHDLRHSAATILLSMKVHPKVVQEILGHSQITTTMDSIPMSCPPCKVMPRSNGRVRLENSQSAALGATGKSNSIAPLVVCSGFFASLSVVTQGRACCFVSGRCLKASCPIKIGYS